MCENYLIHRLLGGAIKDARKLELRAHVYYESSRLCKRSNTNNLTQQAHRAQPLPFTWWSSLPSLPFLIKSVDPCNTRLWQLLLWLNAAHVATHWLGPGICLIAVHTLDGVVRWVALLLQTHHNLACALVHHTASWNALQKPIVRQNTSPAAEQTACWDFKHACQNWLIIYAPFPVFGGSANCLHKVAAPLPWVSATSHTRPCRQLAACARSRNCEASGDNTNMEQPTAEQQPGDIAVDEVKLWLHFLYEGGARAASRFLHLRNRSRPEEQN